MVQAVRDTEKALGKVNYSLTEQKKASRQLGRSLFVVKDIKAGEAFTEDNVRSISPGHGMEPKYYYDILGEKASVDVQKGTPLRSKYIDKR